MTKKEKTVEKEKTELATPSDSNKANGPKSLRGLDVLVKDSWSIFARGWKKYLIFYLISMAILVGAGLLSILLLAATMFLVKGLLGLIIGIFFIIIILALFASPLGLAMNKLVYGFGEHQEEGIKEALRYGVKNFPSYILISVVTGLLIFVGLIFLIIPGIIIGVMLSLIAPIFILENNHKLGILKRSRELVRGYFWPVFGRLALLIVISGAVSSTQRITPDIAALNVVQSIFSMVANFILTFFGIAYTYLIFKDLSIGNKQ